MASVKELHEKAMEIAQNAMLAKENGEYTSAKKIYYDAFKIEQEAAYKVPKAKKSEPTRSILFRSAASLAYQAEELKESIRMIGEGLSGHPSKRIFNELNILHEEVKLAIYNKENHYQTSPEQFVFHLTGNAVSHGSIYYKEFLDRIDALQKSLRKTASRMIDIPFNSRKEFLVPTFHSPTSGSFAIKVSISIKHDDNGQGDLVSNPTEIINEFLGCITLVQNNDDDALFERIQESNYLDHFLSHIKKIAPDGNKITAVDFIINDNVLSLSRLSKTIPLKAHTIMENDIEEEIENIEITGVLDYASSRKTDTIGITDVDNKRYNIKIEDGIEDYVRSYYMREVKVEGVYDQKWIYPININPVDD